MESPWYQDGLRFRCTQCGSCCTGAPGFVWVNDEELDALAKFQGEPRENVEKFYARRIGERRSLRERANGDCVFYDKTAGCTIYPVRPRQCRTWPFWDSNVRTPEDWEETCERCPGSGQGDLIPADEITRRLQVIKL
ncbi:MAG TPA: YkgJ family cysteine cluster protein [Gemmataceae bacterium]|jgi:Fe-S-cluster containining protein|nr:YkgJ family cysteine cluster protein [Gemmataceae bacterium]